MRALCAPPSALYVRWNGETYTLDQVLKIPFSDCRC